MGRTFVASLGGTWFCCFRVLWLYVVECFRFYNTGIPHHFWRVVGSWDAIRRLRSEEWRSLECVGQSWDDPLVHLLFMEHQAAISRIIPTTLPNERTSGNGAVAVRFHFRRLSRAVPECES